jgi:hypothetical protein
MFCLDLRAPRSSVRRSKALTTEGTEDHRGNRNSLMSICLKHHTRSSSLCRGTFPAISAYHSSEQFLLTLLSGRISCVASSASPRFPLS